MKKQLFLIASLIAMFGCSKEAVEPQFSPLKRPAQAAEIMTITTGTPETNEPSLLQTKTAISGTTPSWKAGDRVTVVYTNTSSVLQTAKSAGLASDTDEATFSVALISPKTDVQAYAYYPANPEAPASDEATLVIPGRQKPNGSSFDGAADILVSKPFTPSGSVVTQFRRLGAVLKIQFSNDLIGSDNLKKVLVTADTPLSGKVTVDLSSGEATGISSSCNSVVAEYSASTKFAFNAADKYVYLIVYPQTLASGSHLTIVGETENCTFSREIVLASDIVLRPGHIQPLSIPINDSAVNKIFFTETFGGTDSTLGTGNGTFNPDNDSWDVTNGYAAGSGGHSARFGTSSSMGIATTPSISVPSQYRGKNLKLSFKAAAWNYEGEATTLAVSASGTGVSLSGAALSSGEVSTTKGTWNTYTLDIGTTASTSSLTVTFQSVRAKNARFFLDDVIIGYGDLSYSVVDNVPAYVPVLPQYLSCYEMPAISLDDPSTYTATGEETFGDTNWYEYHTDNAKRRIVTHTYEYSSKVYRNFTAMIDQDKRCPLWTAYPMHAEAYPDNDVERVGSFNESTSYDPAIPNSWQSSGSTDDYISNGDGFARGHHCASQDRQVTEYANKQTFYYTNQSPQWQNNFNGGMWATLEGAVQSHAPTGSDTLYVVVGTIFDPLNMHASNDGGEVGRPSHFYKLLMYCTFDGSGNMTGASGVAYLYTNEAHPAPATYNDATFRKSIDYIEGLTGFDFFANVPAALQSTAESTNDSLW